MTKRACFSFRPRLEDARQRQAWGILQSVPEGQRTAFVARAILQSEEQEMLLQSIRQILRDELAHTALQTAVPQSAPAPKIPDQMLEFLSTL